MGPIPLTPLDLALAGALESVIAATAEVRS